MKVTMTLRFNSLGYTHSKGSLPEVVNLLKYRDGGYQIYISDWLFWSDNIMWSDIINHSFITGA